MAVANKSSDNERMGNKAIASANRIYTIGGIVFFIGLIAVGGLGVISIINKASTIAILCEAVVFLCLIIMLVLVQRAKNRLEEQKRYNDRFPYASVDKKEIETIFDIIADEERKREKLDRFAANSPSSRQTVVINDVSSDSPSSSSATARPEAPAAASKTLAGSPTVVAASPGSGANDEEETVCVVPDDGGDDVKPASKEPVSAAKEDKMDNESKERLPDKTVSEGAADEPIDARRPREEDSNKPKSDGAKGRPEPGERPAHKGKKKRPPTGKPGERPVKGRPGERPPMGKPGEYPPKKRPPDAALRDPRAPGKKRPGVRDPYADEYYYYNEYGEPIRRRPPMYDPYLDGYYYNEYGEPIRRRDPYAAKDAVYYNEYGEPIRRRPPVPYGIDPRREEALRRKKAAGAGLPIPPADPRKRPPGAAGAKMPAAVSGAKPSAIPNVSDEEQKKRMAAPVSMPSLRKEMDDDYVPVNIPDDDDYERALAAPSRRVAPPKRSPEAAQQKRPAPPIIDDTPYSPREMEAMPIVVPEDEYYPQYEEEIPPPKKKAPPPPPIYDDIPVEEDPGVVVVADFDDMDSQMEEMYSREPQPRRSAPPAAPSRPAQSRARVQLEEEEDEAPREDDVVVVLPHDEGYDNYLQRLKEEEERKAAEERRQARKISGKTALTIRKIRRKKIKRKSRKYKRFRASVITLAKYLSNLLEQN